MRKGLTDRDINEHFLGKSNVIGSTTTGRFTGIAPNLANTPKAKPPQDKIMDARVLLWESLKLIGQAKHENQQQPVVDNHLKEADEKVRAALRLIL